MESLDHPTTSTKRRAPSEAFKDLHAGTNPLAVAKDMGNDEALPPHRSLATALTVLVRWMLIIVLTMINLLVDGPVSWKGFDALAVAIPAYAGHPEWTMSADVSFTVWVFIFVVSTLSLGHIALNWKRMIQGRHLFKSLCFVLFILVPSQSVDVLDSTAGLYALFIPLDLAALHMTGFYIATAVAILCSFVFPLWAILLGKEAYEEAKEEQSYADATNA